MVNNVTSLTQSGLRDWLVQRTSAIILGLYGIFLFAFLLLNKPLTFDVWHSLFSNNLMKLFTLLALLSLVLHAWVGIWTVFTDYIKPPLLRLTLQILMILSLICYFVWGIVILWGI